MKDETGAESCGSRRIPRRCPEGDRQGGHQLTGGARLLTVHPLWHCTPPDPGHPAHPEPSALRHTAHPILSVSYIPPDSLYYTRPHLLYSL